MKDKRQRIAVAWPYAAVYSDPAFAASILQGRIYFYNVNVLYVLCVLMCDVLIVFRMKI